MVPKITIYVTKTLEGQGQDKIVKYKFVALNGETFYKAALYNDFIDLQLKTDVLNITSMHLDTHSKVRQLHLKSIWDTRHGLSTTNSEKEITENIDALHAIEFGIEVIITDEA